MIKRTGPSVLIALVLAGVLVACTSTGNNFNESKISKIKKGATTEATLVEWFGEPQQRGMTSEGKTTLTWTYIEATVKGESFIPYAGAFLGGTNSKNKTLSATLSNGKVATYTYTGGGSETRGTIQEVPKE